MTSDDFWGWVAASVLPAIAWFFLLTVINGEAVGNVEANRIFYSYVLALYGTWGSLLIWEDKGGWIALGGVAIVGVIVTAYFATSNPSAPILPTENYLVGVFYSVFTGLSFGTLIVGTWGYFEVLRGMKKWRDHLNRNARQNAKNADAQADFSNAFDNDDSDFSYDDSAFKPKPKRRKPAPRGYEKRHPDDAKYWAFIDDPNASDQERKTALEMILKAQAKRNGKTTKTKRVTSRK